MKTIFQTGFRPANPFESGFNPLGSYRLGQDEFDWGEEPSYTWEQSPMPSSDPVPSEEDEWRSLQQVAQSNVTTPTTPSTLEQIAKGVAAGAAGAAQIYAKSEAEKAKLQTQALKPGTLPLTPRVPPPAPAVSSTAVLLGVGALALIGITAAAVL